MVFSNIVSSPLASLSLQHVLDLANVYLEGASRAQHPDIALVLCHDTDVALHQAKKAAKRIKDQELLHGVAVAYIGLGRELENRGRNSEAHEIYKKAEKWGVKAEDHIQPVPTPDLKSEIPTNTTLDPSPDTSSVTVTSEKKKKRQGQFTATIPDHIFAENVRPPTMPAKLPDPDERLISTPQLACCLGLLKDSHDLDDILEPVARNWLQVVENDEDEHERLKILAMDVIRTFKKEEIKDAKVVAEVVCLAPVIDKDIFRDLLRTFYDGIDHSGLLDVHQVQGLARLIQGADTGYLDADDLVKILGLLTTRLRETHQQSPQHIYQLTLAASNVLDAMADTKVSGLDREALHEPLSLYLDAMKGNSEPYLVYQAAYACQALLCVPDNETPWQATVRRTSKVIQGVSGLVSAVKGLDLNGFIDGLKNIQQGLSGASEVVQVVVTAFDGVKSITAGGQGFLDGVREGLSFKRKCAWYAALRGADELIRDGEFASFKKLVCEAPCRQEVAFLWGVCQRLGEVASNSMWDVRTRRSAATFLVEIYQNDEEWGDQASINEWIVIILMRLSSSAGAIQQYIEGLLHDLESSIDAGERVIFQACRDKNLNAYPLKIALPSLASPSLLDRVQNKPDVEGTLRQMRKQRLKERGNAVYIRPQAKAGLKASDDQHFPLMEKVEEFLSGDQKVLLLLGDSGAGKSTFNQQLECDLWHKYKKTTGRIPLFINLPAIDKPEQDMIAKQLRKCEFTEPEIRELKVHRRLILICDGYDESQQTHNLYMSNRLNQPGEWNVQMVISCRSEYLGADYRDRFQPGDRNSRSESGQFQEAVITPFTPDQVQDYIKQYVQVHQPLWEAKDYVQALDLIPSLKELVRNPFLMTLSLEVLPRMVDPGVHLSATQVTRVALYDQFIEHWLERGKKRLSEKELSPQAKAAFESLVDEGFTRNGIDFLKKLSVAIYKEQGGQPIVSYSRFKDEGSWKAEYFSREEEKQLLREACPLTRSGNQYRFIHRSLLEYGLALAIFDPHDWKEKPLSATVSSRRGSTSSAYSFHIHGSSDEAGVVSAEEGPDYNSPLSWRYFMNEPSILEFLCERITQESVFKDQLLEYIKQSKTDKKWRTAAANAITVLVRAGVQFNCEDLQGIQIPGADLSYGSFDSAQLQDADLRRVNFRGTVLHCADLSRAQMSGVQFGELPFLKEDYRRVFSCAYSSDGKSFAVGLSNGDIRLYSTSTWEQARTLSGRRGVIASIAYSPKGDRLISGSYNTAQLWDVDAGTLIYALSGHGGNVKGVAFSPCGGSFASADGCTVKVWDAGTGECQLILIGHEDNVTSVAYSPNGHVIASGSMDTTLRLWDVQTGTRLHTLSDHTWGISTVAYSPRGDRIASGGGDKTVRIWDVETGACVHVLAGHWGWVRCVAFSPQGDTIVSAGDDETVRIWDAETGTCRQVLTGHNDSVRSVVFSPKGNRIACGSDDGTVRLWDVGSGGTRQIAIGNNDTVLSVKYSPHGHQSTSCSTDGSIRLWDVEKGDCRHLLTGHTNWVRSIAYSPRGDLLVSCSDDSTLRLWDVETGVCRKTFIGHSGYVLDVVCSPQGDRVASGDNRGSVRIWDVGTGECLFILIGHTNEVSSIVYSPKGNQIASASDNRTTIRLWDVGSGDCLHHLSGHDSGVTSIAYSPQGDLLVSSSYDLTVKLWDVATGDCRYILIGHTNYVQFAVYSLQGDQVASGGDDKSVKTWDVRTGECLHTLAGHTELVTSVIYSLQGDRIVSSSRDMTIRLWDVASGQCQAVIQNLDTIVTGIAWSTVPGANCFVAGCRDGSMYMWRMIEDGGECRVRSQWRWRAVNGELNVTDTLVQDVRGLSRLNKQLLEQRGAVGEPFVRLRETSKKVTSMLSVVSALKQPAIEEAPGSFSADNLVTEQLEHEQEHTEHPSG
ncbi:MAG: WD40-repeat-containing domain protein [Benniella sp.]|nr:MAG: WD40-repeat-containing domain protein [Benniella sp.]